LKISFSTGHASEVSIAVYDLSGRVIRRLVDGRVEAGDHSISWDGRAENGAIIGHGCFELAAVIDGSVYVKKLVVMK
jgi:flagellar hook assembly protein FlgD